MKPIVINYEPARSLYFRHARNYNRKVYYYACQSSTFQPKQMRQGKITQSTTFHRENQAPQSLQKKYYQSGRYSSALLEKDKKLKSQGYIDMNLSDLTNFIAKKDLKEPTKKFSEAINQSFIKNEQIKKSGSLGKASIKDTKRLLKMNIKKFKTSKVVPISIHTKQFFNQIKRNHRIQNAQDQLYELNDQSVQNTLAGVKENKNQVLSGIF